MSLSVSARGHRASLRLPSAAFSSSLAASLAALACLLAHALRDHHLGRPTLSFLSFNLFLAALPVAFALALRVTLPRSLALGALCAVAWLAFFPNSHYLVTDLVHLRRRPPVPFLVDVLFFFTFAGAGTLLGAISLSTVYDAVSERFGRITGLATATLGSALGGYGIYLGRILRLNSWELATEPLATARRSLAPIFDPRRVGFALTFSALAALLIAGSFTALLLLRVPGRRDPIRPAANDDHRGACGPHGPLC